MTHEAKPIMARRDGNVSLVKPWVEALTIQAQGSLLSALRGPDGVHKNDPAKALVRAFRATVVNNAKGPGPDDVFMGDGSGVCEKDDVDLFLGGVDRYQHHWYLHFLHAAEIVGYMHPNGEIRRFWIGFYERAAEGLHLLPEPREMMLARLGKDGALVDAGERGPCGVCGERKLVSVLLTERLRAKMGGDGAEGESAGLCANCLTPRTSVQD